MFARASGWAREWTVRNANGEFRRPSGFSQRAIVLPLYHPCTFSFLFIGNSFTFLVSLHPFSCLATSFVFFFFRYCMSSDRLGWITSQTRMVIDFFVALESSSFKSYIPTKRDSLFWIHQQINLFFKRHTKTHKSSFSRTPFSLSPSLFFSLPLSRDNLSKRRTREYKRPVYVCVSRRRWTSLER